MNKFFILLFCIWAILPSNTQHPSIALYMRGPINVNEKTSWVAYRTGFHGILSIIVPTTVIGPTGYLLDDTGTCTNIQWQDTIEIQCYPSRSDAILTVTGIAGPHTPFMTITASTTDERTKLSDTQTQLIRGVKYLNHPLMIIK